MIKKYIYSLILMAAMSLTFVSCVADIEANSKSVFDYTDNDVKSYGDLFEVFWSVMNQRYCDLTEQAGTSSVDWDQVYAQYKPQFDSLKTFSQGSEFTQAEIQADNEKAKKYFDDIVGNIIDQHFYVKVTLPVSHSSTETVLFDSELRKRDTYVHLSYRWGYLKNHLSLDGTAFAYGTPGSLYMFGGFLKNHPDIYYLGFSEFSIIENCYYTYKEDYLPVNKENSYHLDQQTIIEELSMSGDPKEKYAKAAQEAVTLLSAIDQYLASEDVQTACKKMTAYSNDRDYYGMWECAKKAGDDAPGIIKNLTNTNDVTEVTKQITKAMERDSTCQAICADGDFEEWYSAALAQYLCHERELNAFWTDLMFTYNHPLVEAYRRKFLEPLAAGKINKLILDVRGNGGGNVADTRLLTDFLVSRSAVYCYARKKEDNNPYGYSPWVPQQISVTSSSLGRDIPTVVLIDNHSASMSESTTLILKSQGDHVKTVGRNSCGALCMLTDENSSNNGGWIGKVTSYLEFYMPFMMTKDVNGNVLEAVGITPDYTLPAMTDEEISKMVLEPASFKDRDMDKAIEILH